MKRSLAAALLLSLLAVVSLADEGDFTILNFGPNVSVIQYEDLDGVRANVAAIRGRKGVIVVNTFLTPAATAFALNVVEDRFHEDILYLINTNPTLERTGGNQLFKKYTIIAHRDARDILKQVFDSARADQANKQEALKRLEAELESRENTETPEYQELNTRKEQLSAYLDSLRATAYTLPESSVLTDNAIDLFSQKVRVRLLASAATSADLLILFEDEKVVVCGDVVVEGVLPLWDAAKGGSLRGLLGATKEILTLEESYDRIVPGFGTPGGFEIVKTQHEYLLNLMSAVKSALAEGGDVQSVYDLLAPEYVSNDLQEQDLKAAIAQAWIELE